MTLRFLVDNSVSPLVAERLRQAGFDARHVRDYELHAATDDTIFGRAADEDRVIISADTDFGTILALRREKKPSVILIRHGFPRQPEQQAPLMLANLPQIEQALHAGCIVIFEGARIRIRPLPISE